MHIMRAHNYGFACVRYRPSENIHVHGCIYVYMYLFVFVTANKCMYNIYIYKK